MEVVKPEGRAGFWKKRRKMQSGVAKHAKFSHGIVEGGNHQNFKSGS